MNPQPCRIIERLAIWRRRPSEFDFDVEQCASINPQATDALLRLNTTGQHESRLEHDVPLYTIDSLDNLHTPAHAVALDGDRARNVSNTSPSDDETKYDPQTTVKLIRAYQPNILCRTAATQAGHLNCEFEVS